MITIRVTEAHLKLDAHDADAAAQPHPTRRRQSINELVRPIVDPQNFGFIALLVAYVLWFVHQAFAIYNAYGSPPFDMAIFDQGLWLTSHFQTPFVTVIGRNLFGDHTSFILGLIVPIYRLFPEPQGILVVETMLLASAAIPVYVLARKLLKSAAMATALAAVLLFNPILQRGNLDQFHPEAFQVLFIAVAIYAAHERKYRVLLVMVVLSLLVKEDAGALIVPLGIWVSIRRDRRVGMTVVVLGIIWSIAANFFIIPALLGGATIYTRRIPFGGATELLGVIFHRPTVVIKYFLSGGRPFYLWQLGAMTAFIALLAPDIVAIGALVIGENLLSTDLLMHNIIFQYTLPLSAVLAMAVVIAIARQKRRRDQWLLTGEVLAATLLTCAIWGAAPFSQLTTASPWVTPSGVRALNHLEQSLPPNAVVSAWYPIVAHVDHRTQVYMWPNPFAQYYWGFQNHSGRRLPVARNVQYLLLPIKLSSDDFPGLFMKLKPDFTLIHHSGGYGIYERKAIPTGVSRRFRDVALSRVTDTPVKMSSAT